MKINCRSGCQKIKKKHTFEGQSLHYSSREGISTLDSHLQDG